MADDDGVALQSADHPLLITDAMLDAGVTEFWRTGVPGQKIHEQLRAAYTAMVRAAPPVPELNEEPLEPGGNAVFTISKDTVERLAVRCALGPHVQDVQWPPGADEERKEVWRQFVRELAAEIFDAPRQIRIITDKDDAIKD